MGNSIPKYLLSNSPTESSAGKRIKLSFLDRTILNTGKAGKSIYLQSENATKENFIQKISPHVKFLSLIYFVVMISFARDVSAQTLTSVFIFLLFIIARISLFQVYRRIIIVAFIFGFIVISPASLNVITNGDIVFNLVTLNKPLHFWIFNIPQNIGFTENGIQVVSLFFLRVLNSVSFAMLVVFTTPFTLFIKSFKKIGVPDTFLMIISLAYKYVFILCRTIEETYLALKSRLSGDIKSSSIRKLVGGRVLFIFKRSQIIYEGTYFAMVSRGYDGKIKLPSQTHLNYRDIVSLFVNVVFGIVIVLL
jgi:cobalt/nickel transport system permease protein